MTPPLPRYFATAQRLFAPLRAEDTLSEEALREAEARLRLSLPSLLRQVYRESGRRTDLHAVHHRLLPLDELAVEGGALVFYEGAERRRLWGILLSDLAAEDPPVRGAPSAARPAWSGEAEPLSGFLESMLYEQRVHAGPWAMKRKVGRPLLERFAALYPRVEVRGAAGRCSRWFGEGQVLIRVEGEPPSAVVTVAAPEQEQLLRLAEQLEISWSDAVWTPPEGVPRGAG